VHVISRKALRDFAATHADAATPLDAWYRIAKQASWASLVDVRAVYPSADLVGAFVVFNIKGNAYRLIARIDFRSKTLFIRGIYTHADYDRGKWK
jgi:mRNA interferase HigB